MLKSILFWIGNRRQALRLAMHAEALAASLNASYAPPANSQRDIVAILQSTCALMQQFIDEQQRADQARTEESAAVSPVEQGQATVVAPVAGQDQEVEPVKMDKSVVVPVAPAEATLSATAKELMKISDWVLLAKASGTAVQPEVLEEIHRQLTMVLLKEGVTLIDATGPCDYERQMVVGTQPTDDPAQNEHVYSTVRPGYLFGQQIIRPQEVIIYSS